MSTVFPRVMVLSQPKDYGFALTTELRIIFKQKIFRVGVKRPRHLRDLLCRELYKAHAHW